MWDYIVIGGGSAGCVVAGRLADRPGTTVLLLNAGAGLLDRTPIVRAPGGAFYFDRPQLSWRYPVRITGHSVERYDDVFAGKILGGGSAVNGMMFIRGDSQDFDDWESEGAIGWGAQSVLPFFKRLEHTLIGEDEFHGRTGPLGVAYAGPMLDISERFISAAVEAGIPRNDDVNGARMAGVGRTPSTAYNGYRQSTADAYVRKRRGGGAPQGHFRRDGSAYPV